MADESKKSVFSKEAILAKQKVSLEEYQKTVLEMRQAFEQVLSTPSGMKVFRYFFLICGGDLGSVRRDKENKIDRDETLVTLGARSVWDGIRFNLSSDMLKEIERHNWEDKK